MISISMNKIKNSKVDSSGSVDYFLAGSTIPNDWNGMMVYHHQQQQLGVKQ